MNEDTLSGQGRDVVGRFEEAAGNIAGDRSLRAQGLADQLGGNLQQIVGAARDALKAGVERLPEPARRFVKDRPVASAAIAGIASLALLRFLRR
jgi:uncharacterized protein YjbJ (UPF0337 family)